MSKSTTSVRVSSLRRGDGNKLDASSASHRQRTVKKLVREHCNKLAHHLSKSLVACVRENERDCDVMPSKQALMEDLVQPQCSLLLEELYQSFSGRIGGGDKCLGDGITRFLGEDQSVVCRDNYILGGDTSNVGEVNSIVGGDTAGLMIPFEDKGRSATFCGRDDVSVRKLSLECVDIKKTSTNKVCSVLRSKSFSTNDRIVKANRVLNAVSDLIRPETKAEECVVAPDESEDATEEENVSDRESKAYKMKKYNAKVIRAQKMLHDIKYHLFKSEVNVVGETPGWVVTKNVVESDSSSEYESLSNVGEDSGAMRDIYEGIRKEQVSSDEELEHTYDVEEMLAKHEELLKDLPEEMDEGCELLKKSTCTSAGSRDVLESYHWTKREKPMKGKAINWFVDTNESASKNVSKYVTKSNKSLCEEIFKQICEENSNTEEEDQVMCKGDIEVLKNAFTSQCTVDDLTDEYKKWGEEKPHQKEEIVADLQETKIDLASDWNESQMEEITSSSLLVGHKFDLNSKMASAKLSSTEVLYDAYKNQNWADSNTTMCDVPLLEDTAEVHNPTDEKKTEGLCPMFMFRNASSDKTERGENTVEFVDGRDADETVDNESHMNVDVVDESTTLTILDLMFNETCLDTHMDDFAKGDNFSGQNACVTNSTEFQSSRDGSVEECEANISTEYDLEDKGYNVEDCKDEVHLSREDVEFSFMDVNSLATEEEELKMERTLHDDWNFDTFQYLTRLPTEALNTYPRPMSLYYMKVGEEKKTTLNAKYDDISSKVTEMKVAAMNVEPPWHHPASLPRKGFDSMLVSPLSNVNVMMPTASMSGYNNQRRDAIDTQVTLHDNDDDEDSNSSLSSTITWYRMLPPSYDVGSLATEMVSSTIVEEVDESDDIIEMYPPTRQRRHMRTSSLQRISTLDTILEEAEQNTTEEIADDDVENDDAAWYHNDDVMSISIGPSTSYCTTWGNTTRQEEKEDFIKSSLINEDAMACGGGCEMMINCLSGCGVQTDLGGVTITEIEDEESVDGISNAMDLPSFSAPSAFNDFPGRSSALNGVVSDSCVDRHFNNHKMSASGRRTADGQQGGQQKRTRWTNKYRDSPGANIDEAISTLPNFLRDYENWANAEDSQMMMWMCEQFDRLERESKSVVEGMQATLKVGKGTLERLRQVNDLCKEHQAATLECNALD